MGAAWAAYRSDENIIEAWQRELADVQARADGRPDRPEEVEQSLVNFVMALRELRGRHGSERVDACAVRLEAEAVSCLGRLRLAAMEADRPPVAY